MARGSIMKTMDGKIKNFEELAVTPMRRVALELVEAGLSAIDTPSVVRGAVKLDGDGIIIQGRDYSPEEGGRIFVASVGKCALEAAEVLEEILGERVYKGVVIDVHEGKLRRMQSFTGDHPFPSERNILATKALVRMLEETTERDLVIAIVSGGGSSLLCNPQNMTWEEEKDLVQHLFKKGAPIEKINVIRKHLSLATGGYLAKYAYPARVVSLIFSDVPGDDIRYVASGPTVYDPTTVEDAKKVFQEYDVEEECSAGERGLIETPKEEKYFARVENLLVTSNKIALEAMYRAAEERGFKAEIKTTRFDGEARHVGAGIAQALALEPSGTFLLYGGESVVILKTAGGKGGRNLELVLSALRFAKESDVVISFSSDGRDNTEYAGAICDRITREKAEKLGMDPREWLDRNDSFHFFEKTGDFLLTGETGSNVSDLVIAIRQRPERKR